MTFYSSGRYAAARDAALSDPATSAVKPARLTYGGQGMTQPALCLMAGVSKDTLWRAERDPSSVSAAVLRRLARALNVPYDDIAGGDR
jgi:DNA-binding XRE family transcriptional regulator